MKKRDVIIIVVVLVVALAGLVAVKLLTPKPEPGAEYYAYIYIGGELYEADPLDEDKLLEIDQGSGTVNHIEIKNGVVRMVDSTCPDKQCVGQGEMSAENYEQRLLPYIICLPNQIRIELAAKGDGEK